MDTPKQFWLLLSAAGANRGGRGQPSNAEVCATVEGLNGHLYPSVSHMVGRRRLPEAPEDVVSELWLRVLRHPERYDPGRGTVRSFLLAVCHSIVLDLARKHGRRREVTGTLDALEQSGGAAAAGRDADAPERPALSDICAIVQGCPRAQRELFDAMLEPAGGSFPELAERLRAPAGTLRVRWHRLRRRIRAGLRNKGYDIPFEPGEG